MPDAQPRRAADGTLLYPGFPIRDSHPDLIAAVAALHGLDPVSPAKARVLEMGCAGGANLIPLAERYPDAQFVGVDTQAEQIEGAKALVSELGLANITFQQRDLCELSDEDGVFDYILCHGVYSWVEEDVRNQIPAVCAARLTDNGLAYVNYNTATGWHLQAVVKDMLRYFSRHEQGPSERISAARRMLEVITTRTANVAQTNVAALREMLQTVSKLDDEFLLHAYLDADNTPVYFHDFVAHAQEHGLAYVGDSQRRYVARELPATYNPGPDEDFCRGPVDREQLRDFVEHRGSRASVLCRKQTLEQTGSSVGLPDLFVHAWVSAAEAPAGAPEGSRSFRARDGRTLTTPDPILARILTGLADAPNHTLAVREIAGWSDMPVAESPQSLANWELDLLRMFGNGIAELSWEPVPWATTIPDKPRVPSLVRQQAASGDVRLASLRHLPVTVSEADRELLRHLDGSRSVSELVDAGALPDPIAPTGTPESAMNQAIERLMVAGLLFAG